MTKDKMSFYSIIANIHALIKVWACILALYIVPFSLTGGGGGGGSKRGNGWSK